MPSYIGSGSHYERNRQEILARQAEANRARLAALGQDKCIDCGGEKRVKRGPKTFRCDPCGKSLRRKAQLAEAAARRARAKKGCEVCGVAHKRKRFCSPGCATVGRYGPPKACEGCGSEFQPKTYFGRFCSPECRFEAQKKPMDHIGLVRKLGWRRKAAARRLRLSAGVREPVDPATVFERDGWTCRLCGCDTPQDFRGTTKSAAPELDHIVPISRGGEHTYANTQCLCRRCNLFKSNFLPSELRMQDGSPRTEGNLSGAAARAG